MWVPLALSQLMVFFLEILNFIFIGHLNDAKSLAAIGLGNMLCNIFAFALALGMTSALETLASQAYGARNYHLAGVYLTRAEAILTVLFIPLTAFLFFAAPMLKALGQDHEVSDLTGIYVRWALPAIYLFSLTDAHRIFLSAF